MGVGKRAVEGVVMTSSMPPDVSHRRLVSIIVPAYNESACVDELARRLTGVFDSEAAYDWEAIIVENGSTDDTWMKLQAINAKDPRFKIVRLARNFRMDGGLTAGSQFADGDACFFMTADLQDPPEIIPEFLRRWEEGYENIYGVVMERQGTGPFRSFNSKAFYWLAAKLTDGRIPRNASDFRLLDRKAYDAVRSMQERNRFVRGLVAWVGFESIGVPMRRPPRFAGDSKAYSPKVVELAFKGIFAHSYVPLRIITAFGVALSVLSLLVLVASGIFWLFEGVPFSGFGTIVSLVLLLFGVLTFMLGIVSEYVGLIYEEVKARPNFVVSRTLGFARD
jgi:glycosyltransferase involved in cell wall biosynthesis